MHLLDERHRGTSMLRRRSSSLTATEHMDQTVMSLPGPLDLESNLRGFAENAKNTALSVRIAVFRGGGAERAGVERRRESPAEGGTS